MQGKNPKPAMTEMGIFGKREPRQEYGSFTLRHQFTDVVGGGGGTYGTVRSIHTQIKFKQKHGD